MTYVDADAVDLTDLVGTLVLRDDDGFEVARVDRIFNRRLTDRTPAAVLRAATEQDVVLGVRLARERGWQVAVRSGGHSWAQWSVRSDALVIDLAGLHELDVRRRHRHRQRLPRRARAAPSWRRTSPSAGASSPAGTAPPSASAASCSRAGRAGTAAAGAGPRSTSSRSTW